MFDLAMTVLAWVLGATFALWLLAILVFPLYVAALWQSASRRR